MWEHETGGRITGSTVYLAARVARRHRRRHRATHGTVRVGALIASSPSVSGDGEAVVVGAGDGVYAVRADRGEKLWEIHLGLVTGSHAPVGDRIYITGAEVALWALITHA